MPEDNKRFAVGWLTKADLMQCRPHQTELIQQLDDYDMEYIAEKVGHELLEEYWIVVELILQRLKMFPD